MTIDRDALASMAEGEGTEIVPVTRRWLAQMRDELGIADARRGAPIESRFEVIVFRSRRDAELAGWQGDERHPKKPFLIGWWPGAGATALARRPISRVTIPHDMLRHQTGEGRLGDLLRARTQMFGDDVIWLEL